MIEEKLNAPETLAAWKDFEKDGKIVDFLKHAIRMERERNATMAIISAIEERYIDGCDTYEDWKFMGSTARTFLEENDKTQAPT